MIAFGAGVHSVAADLFGSTGYQTWAGTFTATLYDGHTRLGEQQFSEKAYGSGFLGVSSSAPITKIVISFQPTTDGDWSVFVENISFGNPAAVAVSRMAEALATFTTSGAAQARVGSSNPEHGALFLAPAHAASRY